MHSHENKVIFYLDRNPELGLEPGRNYYYQYSFETVNGGAQGPCDNWHDRATRKGRRSRRGER